ncbi:hypothetical protein ACP4OV_023524 [Aristida adscensionis]
MRNLDDDDDDDGGPFALTPPAAGGPWKKGVWRARLVLAAAILPSMLVLLMVCSVATNAREATEIAVELAGVEGLNLNATLGRRTVSPAFNLKVRVENRRVVQPWCYTGGEAVVSYSGAALAWGRVPRFCVRRKAPTEFTVVPWGRGVGVSEDLRRRLASDWHTGAVKIRVDLKVFHDDKGFSPSGIFNGPSLHSFQLMLRGD